jgi:hypothetical protein
MWFTRTLAYLWPAPYTVCGLAIGLLLAGRPRVVAGVIEMHSGPLGWLLGHLPVSAAAVTLGHTVLGCSAAALERTRLHERVHVRQFERWGLAMGPAYLLASLWLWMRGRDWYRQNPFEREAYEAEAQAKRDC